MPYMLLLQYLHPYLLPLSFCHYSYYVIVKYILLTILKYNIFYLPLIAVSKFMTDEVIQFDENSTID